MRSSTRGTQAVLLLVAILAMARPGGLRAQEADRAPGGDNRPLGETPVTAAPAETGPRIDGRLDEDVWEAAAPVLLSWEWFPGDNRPAPVATDCRLLAGRDALYVGCRASDPAPTDIRGHYTERDGASGDDEISVLLDPSGTSRRGYRFAVSALGVQSDALYSEDAGTDDTWDATWASAGRLTAGGYVVEMAIPYRAVRRPRSSSAGADRPWRIVVERGWPRDAAVRIGSMPLDRDDNCLLCQARALAGLSNVSTGRGASLQPTLTASRSEVELEDDGAGVAGVATESDVSPGLSGRWSPTRSARVAVTLNPDFSQVEADAAEFEVNRRFALSFPEKRPFFLDDSDFFDVSEDLLFTRSVVDPVAGAKGTWQAGHHAAGAFVTVDRVNSRILPGNQASERVSTDANVTGLVGRYRLDLPGSSSVGLLATGRFATDYHNAVVAADGTFRFGRSHRLRLLFAGSRADDEPAVEALTGRSGGFSGARWNARYDLDTRSWELEAGFRGFTSGFRSDAGVLQRVDILGPEFQLTRVIRPEEPTWYDVIELDVEGQRLIDFDGDVIDEKVELGAGYAGPLQSEIEVSHAWRRQAFGAELFAIRETEIDVSARPSDAIALGASVAFGDEIDSDNTRLGRGFEAGASVRLLLGRSLRVSLEQRLGRLSVPAGEVFRAWLTQSRFEYHFGLHLFLRTILQYRRIIRDPALWIESVDDESTRLFAQVLLSYELTPRTVVFAGYAGTTSDFEGFDLAPQERSFFLKLGYGWQL